MIDAMWEYALGANDAHCRVKRWNLTRDQAYSLSDDIERMGIGPSHEIFLKMLDGRYHILGALIKVAGGTPELRRVC